MSREMHGNHWIEIAEGVYKVASREALESAYQHWVSTVQEEIPFSDVVLNDCGNPSYPMTVTFRPDPDNDGPDTATRETDVEQWES